MGVCAQTRKQNYYAFPETTVGNRPSPEQITFGTNDSGFPEMTDGELSDFMERTKPMADESPGPEELNRRKVRFSPGLLGFSSECGVVRQITRHSRASRAGVQLGWKITEIDGKPFTQARLDRKRGGTGPFIITFALFTDSQKSFSMSRSITNHGSPENPI